MRVAACTGIQWSTQAPVVGWHLFLGDAGKLEPQHVPGQLLLPESGAEDSVGMSDRQGRQPVHPLGHGAGQEPAEQCAPVVTGDGDAVDAEVVEQAGDVVEDEGEGVVLDAAGFAAVAEAAQIGSDDPMPGLEKSVDLVAPHARSVRETVQQQHRGAFAGVDDVERHPVELDFCGHERGRVAVIGHHLAPSLLGSGMVRGAIPFMGGSRLVQASRMGELITAALVHPAGGPRAPGAPGRAATAPRGGPPCPAPGQSGQRFGVANRLGNVREQQVGRERVETGRIGRRVAAQDPEDRQYMTPVLERGERAAARVLRCSRGQHRHIGTESSWPQPVGNGRSSRSLRQHRCAQRTSRSAGRSPGHGRGPPETAGWPADRTVRCPPGEIDTRTAATGCAQRISAGNPLLDEPGAQTGEELIERLPATRVQDVQVPVLRHPSPVDADLGHGVPVEHRHAAVCLGPIDDGHCRFRGVPNQPESASRSASAAVPVGSSMVAAQAMWASGRIRRASAGR